MAASQMAPGPLSGLKGSDVFQSDYLLQQVANYIHIHHLQSMAIDLEICVTDLDIIKGGKHIGQQRFRVLKKWMDTLPRNFTISEFIEKVERWWQNGYVDRAVWSHLEEEGLDPAILPLSSATERPASKRGVKRGLPPESSSSDDEKCEVDQTDPPASKKNCEIPSEEDAKYLQQQNRGSLGRQCRKMVTKDWLKSDEVTRLTMKENYVDLEWTKLEGGVEKDLDSLFSILDVVDLEKPPEGINLLIEAEPGMGKTWSTAFLAYKWADNTCPKKSPLRKMDYVFWIRLREVDKSTTLAETIINQHDKIKPEHKKHLTEILKGKTNHRVLILMDGYDEYQPGTNSDIDDAINCSVGNCVLILTSRPNFLNQAIRNKFVEEVKIKGLSERKIDEFCELMLKKKPQEFLKQAKAAKIEQLFQVPTILYITCLLYLEQPLGLSGSRAELFKKVFEMIMDRSTLKHMECKRSSEISSLQDLLFELGKISWKSRDNGVKQLLLNEDDIKGASPDILKLGLLIGSRNDVTSTTADPQYFTFQHNLLHEYAAAIYVAKRLNESPDTQATLSEFFPSWDDIKKQEEVIMFTHGLMENPAPLVHHVGQLFVDDFKIAKCMGIIATVCIFDSTNRLFEYFFAEPHLVCSKYHNMYFNLYDHGGNLDLSPIYYPSHVYWFEKLRQLPSISFVKKNDISTCSICVVKPDVSITEDLLRVCHKLSLEQPIVQLSLSDLKGTNDRGGTTEREAMTFNLSPEARLIFIHNCDLEPQVIRHLFSQIYRCVGLQQLICINAGHHLEVDDLDLSSLSSLTVLTLGVIDMSPEMCEKICRDLKYLVALEELNLCLIPIATSCCYLTEAVSRQPTLKNIFLSGVSIPLSMLLQLIMTLHNCPKMVKVDISDNEDKQGVTIEQKEASIEALPLVEDYSLKNCHLPGWFCSQVLKSLSRSKTLRELDLSGNVLTDTLHNFLSGYDESLPELERLELMSTGLGQNDLEHLKNVISQGKLPTLKVLVLSSDYLESPDDFAKDLKQKTPQLRDIQVRRRKHYLHDILSHLDLL